MGSEETPHTVCANAPAHTSDWLCMPAGVQQEALPTAAGIRLEPGSKSESVRMFLHVDQGRHAAKHPQMKPFLHFKFFPLDHSEKDAKVTYILRLEPPFFFSFFFESCL